MLNAEVLAPSAGQKAENAVIFLHGLGDSGAGLIGLGEEWRSGLPNTLFLAPDAPAPCDMNPFGYQWFSAQDWTPSVVLAGVKKSAAPLNAFIDAVIEKNGFTPDKIALVGFSQGTIMSLYVAPRRTPSLAGVLGYSGAIVGGESLPRERASAPPIMLIHGTADTVIPFEASAHAAAQLQNVNINVSLLPCQGADHCITAEGLREGLIFLRRVLGS